MHMAITAFFRGRNGGQQRLNAQPNFYTLLVADSVRSSLVFTSWEDT